MANRLRYLLSRTFLPLQKVTEEVVVFQDMLKQPVPDKLHCVDFQIQVAFAVGPVSYTHLDVYKRQILDTGFRRYDRLLCSRMDSAWTSFKSEQNNTDPFPSTTDTTLWPYQKNNSLNISTKTDLC